MQAAGTCCMWSHQTVELVIIPIMILSVSPADGSPQPLERVCVRSSNITFSFIFSTQSPFFHCDEVVSNCRFELAGVYPVSGRLHHRAARQAGRGQSTPRWAHWCPPSTCCSFLPSSNTHACGFRHQPERRGPPC